MIFIFIIILLINLFIASLGFSLLQVVLFDDEAIVDGKEAVSMVLMGIFCLILSYVFTFHLLPDMWSELDKELEETNYETVQVESTYPKKTTEEQTFHMKKDTFIEVKHIKSYEEGFKDGLKEGLSKGRESVYRDLLGIDTLTN